MEHRISVVINSLNEEKNIVYALRSVRSWVDEIVVVDMHSSDRTVEIAQEFGARVYFHERLDFVEPARTFGLEQATGDWILILDADEMVPLPLSQRLRQIAQQAEDVDVVRIPWLNYLLGAPLEYTGWGPRQDKHMRFFKRGFVAFSSKIHDLPSLSAKARICDLKYENNCAIVHFNYLDVSQFIEKLNRYTTVETLQLMEHVDRPSYVAAIGYATKEFFLRYVKARGYRDGWRGFYLSMLMGFYRLVTYAKLTEIENVGTREVVQRIYREEAERIAAAYQ